MTDVPARLAEIRRLYERHASGDIADRTFEREIVERTVDLYRAAAEQGLEKGEAVQAEHHAVLGHFTWTQSVMSEPEQSSVSLFATDRRLIRLRAQLIAGRAATADDNDGTVIDSVRFDSITELRSRRRVRIGEAIAGAAISALALLFDTWLLITGTLLLVLGIAGMLHAMLLPMRWIEIRTAGPDPPQPICIYATRKQSARVLVKYLRSRITH